MTSIEPPRVASKHVRLLGVPMDLGAGRRGVDMGPSALRYAGLDQKVQALGHTWEDGGDVSVPIPERRDRDQKPRFLKEITRVCQRLAHRVEHTLAEGSMPLVIGGDHSMAIGTITGVASHFRKKDEKVGLIWVDAHADMNVPETSPSGNIHGMPLSSVLGYGAPELVELGGFSPKIDADNAVLIGIRSVDQGELDVVLRSGIHYFEMMKIDALGIGEVVRRAIEIAGRGTAGIHLSFDIDGVDPMFAPGVGTPVQGGLSMREAHLICEMMADSGKVVSMEFAEVNPIHDNANATGKLCRDLIASALGQKVIPGLPPSRD